MNDTTNKNQNEDEILEPENISAEEAKAETTPPAEPDKESPSYEEAVFENGDMQQYDTAAEEESFVGENASEDDEDPEEIDLSEVDVKISAGAAVIAVVSLLAVCLSAIFLALTVQIAVPVIKGDIAKARHELGFAEAYYEEAQTLADSINQRLGYDGTMKFFTPGTKTFYKRVKLIAVTDGPETAASFLGDSETGSDAKLPKEIKDINETVKVWSEFNNYVMTDLNAYYESLEENKPVFDDFVAVLDKLKKNDTIKYPAQCYLYMYYRIAYSCEENEKALSYLEEYRKSYPDESWSYGPAIVSLYHETKKYDKVLSYFDDMMKFNSNDRSAYYFKAYTLFDQGKKEEAIKFCDVFSENSRDDYLPLIIKSKFLRQTGDAKASLAVCEDGIKEFPSNTDLVYNKAIALLLLNRASEAQTMLDEITQSENANAAFFYLYLVTIAAMKDDAQYKEVSEYITTNGGDIPQKVTDYAAGKLTLEDLFVKGTADIL